MSAELVNRRLRNKLADLLAGFTLREIAEEFDAENIQPLPAPGFNGGQRRTLVQEYYNGLNFTTTRDVRKFLNVLETIMSDMERRSLLQGEANLTLEEFKDLLKRDGYNYQHGKIHSVNSTARLDDAKIIANHFDASHMREQIQRIEASIDNDPALAIGTAKELTESCFKTILVQRQITYEKGDDLPDLAKKVFKVLKLVRDDVTESSKGADTIKRVLSNLSTIVQGVAELRSLYGTGHGKDGRARGLQPRHARLVVGAASTLVTFVFQTHLEERAASNLEK